MGVLSFAVILFFILNSDLIINFFDASGDRTRFVLFQPPTEENGTLIDTRWTEVNVSVNDKSLNFFKLNWDGTDYLLYDYSLKLDYNFNNNSDIGDNSSVAVDSSLYMYNGALFGADWVSSGRFGSAISLRGDDYVVASGSYLKDMPSPFTIEAWVYANSGPGYYGIVSNFMDSSHKGVSLFLLDSEGSYRLMMDDSGYNSFDGSKDLKDNIWHYLAVTYDGRIAKVYLDGLYDNSAAMDYSPGGVSFVIGRVYSDMNLQYFKGKIDEVRVYERDLSREEVALHYLLDMYKYNQSEYRFYVNVSSLSRGPHSYFVWANNSRFNQSTESRTVICNAPHVVTFSLPTEINNTVINRNWTEVGVSVAYPDLDSFSFNWDNINYSFYDSSLRLDYNLNNNSKVGDQASVAFDSSIYNYSGSLLGPVWDNHGRFGSCLSFDGLNDYVLDTGQYLKNLSAPFSMEVWINAFSGTGYYGILSNFQDSFPKGVSIFLVSTTGCYRLMMDDNGYNSFDGSKDLKDNSWHHLTVTYNGSNVSVYLDGVFDKSSLMEYAPGGQSFVLGRVYSDYNDQYFNGKIDEVRVYKRVLSSSEVRMHYQSEIQKHSLTEYRFYCNVTGLVDDSYDYYARANNSFGAGEQTDDGMIRTIKVRI